MRFTDAPIRPGVTPVRAVHFTELRTRIDALRREAGLGPFAWTDPVLKAGVTRVRLAHLLELREALAAAYAAAGRSVPRWTDAAPVGGTTPIRAVHLMELRAAVVGLELIDPHDNHIPLTAIRSLGSAIGPEVDYVTRLKVTAGQN